MPPLAGRVPPGIPEALGAPSPPRKPPPNPPRQEPLTGWETWIDAASTGPLCAPAAMAEVLRMPDVRERLVGMAMEVAAPGPDEMKRKVESDAARWVALAKELDIKPLD